MNDERSYCRSIKRHINNMDVIRHDIERAGHVRTGTYLDIGTYLHAVAPGG